jgi:hypothetical protein
MTLVSGRTMQNGGAPSWEHQMSSLPLRDIDERLGIEKSSWKAYVSGELDYLSPDFALSEEEIAAIADDLTLPEWVTQKLAGMRGRA